MYPENAVQSSTSSYDRLSQTFVAEARAQLLRVDGEIAVRNGVITRNDSYIYGDLLRRSLKVETGHDFTPVNWLRRVCEIHRTQTVGDGFNITSSYHGVDVDSAFDPSAKPQLDLINNKKKTYAAARNKLFDAIMRDNGGDALFGDMVENASAVGDTILEAYYDSDAGKYCLEMIEATEHFYVVWNKDNFRKFDFTGYVYQISLQEAIDYYGVPTTTPTSPLGSPLVVMDNANNITYISTQPMVTVMKINGKIMGWCSTNGTLARCTPGKETPMEAIIVSDKVVELNDDKKKIPKYYIFPNKRIRRRPWGLADITPSAISINQTYIETLSDWRTVASKVNFPKYKGLGFGMDVQIPKPKSRTVEILGLGEGQDIQPLENPNSSTAGEGDFQRQLQELKEAFVRETGISQQLFDMPDAPEINSGQMAMVALKSISDQVEARRILWEPIIRKVFDDALDTLALWDDSINEILKGDDDFYTRVEWPPAMRKDDPAFVTMVLNQSISGFQSIQTMFERLGFNAKEEIDRINDEMDNPITAAMHGKLLAMLAEYKIAGPPTSAPPKVSVSLSGALTPEQEANLASMHDFGDGPIYGPSTGPQGELGIRADDDAVNSGRISGQGYVTGQPIISGGQPLQQQGGQPPAPGAQGGSAQPASPQTMTPTTGGQPGGQVMTPPGSGQPAPNSPQGNINQNAQRSQKKK